MAKTRRSTKKAEVKKPAKFDPASVQDATGTEANTWFISAKLVSDPKDEKFQQQDHTSALHQFARNCAGNKFQQPDGALSVVDIGTIMFFIEVAIQIVNSCILIRNGRTGAMDIRFEARRRSPLAVARVRAAVRSVDPTLSRQQVLDSADAVLQHVAAMSISDIDQAIQEAKGEA